MRSHPMWAVLLLMIAATVVSAQNKRDKQVQEDKKNLADKKDWVYNDLDQGIRIAKQTKKPLFIVFR